MGIGTLITILNNDAVTGKIIPPKIMINVMLDHLLINLPKMMCQEVVKKIINTGADCIVSIKCGDTV